MRFFLTGSSAFFGFGLAALRCQLDGGAFAMFVTPCFSIRSLAFATRGACSKLKDATGHDPRRAMTGADYGVANSPTTRALSWTRPSLETRRRGLPVNVLFAVLARRLFFRRLGCERGTPPFSSLDIRVAVSWLVSLPRRSALKIPKL